MCKPLAQYCFTVISWTTPSTCFGGPNSRPSQGIEIIVDFPKLERVLTCDGQPYDDVTPTNNFVDILEAQQVSHVANGDGELEMDHTSLRLWCGSSLPLFPLCRFSLSLFLFLVRLSPHL